MEAKPTTFGLTRKPRKGDRLYYPPSHDGGDYFGTVLRCEGNICWYQRDEWPEPDLFIWSFPRTSDLNRLFTLVAAESPNRRTVCVTFANGDTITTEINGTEDSIRRYYLGNEFQFGDTDANPGDDMQRGTQVEFLD